jgi:hypothetical protein
LGRSVRDKGHNRVPDPPDRITGTIVGDGMYGNPSQSPHAVHRTRISRNAEGVVVADALWSPLQWRAGGSISAKLFSKF